MSACIFLFGILYFVMANIQYMIREAESNVGITVFFDVGITDQRIVEIGDEIRNINGVTDCYYLNATDTWNNYKQQYLTDELASTFGADNPLENSMSYTVYFKDVSLENKAAEEIAKIPGVRKVNNSNDVVNTLSKINTALSIGMVFLVGLLLAIAAFLISTTITMGVSIRQKEISIMHLIGATDYFIRGPFLVEGLIIGILGASIPLSILYAMYYKVISLVANRFSGVFLTMNFVSVGEVFKVLVPVSCAISLGIGVLASSFTLAKQLKKIRSL